LNNIFVFKFINIFKKIKKKSLVIDNSNNNKKNKYNI